VYTYQQCTQISITGEIVIAYANYKYSNRDLIHDRYFAVRDLYDCHRLITSHGLVVVPRITDVGLRTMTHIF